MGWFSAQQKNGLSNSTSTETVSMFLSELFESYSKPKAYLLMPSASTICVSNGMHNFFEIS